MARGKPPAGTVSKRKMVKEAMEKLGDATPGEIHKYVKDHYGTDITTAMISSYKSGLKKEAGGGKSALGNTMVGMGDLKAVQDLIAKHGSGTLIAMIKLLSKTSAPAAV